MQGWGCRAWSYACGPEGWVRRAPELLHFLRAPLSGNKGGGCAVSGDQGRRKDGGPSAPSALWEESGYLGGVSVSSAAETNYQSLFGLNSSN